MEGYREDIHEKLETDISACYKDVVTDGVTVKTPITVQGHIAKSLIDKAEHNFLIQLFCPLQALDTLIPNETDIGLALQFSDCARFFVCSKQGVQPKVNIKG